MSTTPSTPPGTRAGKQAGAPAAASSGRAMAVAAAHWLAQLGEAELGVARAPWSDDIERHRWFYTPTDHGGLAISQMLPAQQQAAMQLLGTGLSTAGYVTAATIMGLENVLDHVEGWTASWGRARGRDPQLYYTRVFGDPEGSGPWSWRFGGHHISIQHVVHGDDVLASTPSFFGADPAAAPLLGGFLLRPLGACEDTARDLVHSLDAEQSAQALIDPVAPVDLVGGNRPRLSSGDTVMPLESVWRTSFDDPALRQRVEDMHTGAETKAGVNQAHLKAVAFTSHPKGLAASAMTEEQRDGLRAVLATFLGRMPDELADREAEKFSGDLLHDVHFAWAGGIEPGQPHYYRLQAPRLLAEYDNTQRDVNHIHTVWRDPANDFGDDVLARHLALHHGNRLGAAR